ncbi:hypothetical protein AB0K80_12190 [Streptomyces sp. NPDC052682]|uniref:hypothetical protein n=1 Tax=Streptomyces sp. NPDC052682 TaxID=3154954 RepID=UPI00343499F0
MAFGAEELRVLRRALALALHPSPASATDVQDCLRLAESLDEAMREGARLRAFLVADLGRYRAALPGTAAGYLTLLEEALGAGYRPDSGDLAALRALRGNPTAAALLERCRPLAEQDGRTCPDAPRPAARPGARHPAARPAVPRPAGVRAGGARATPSSLAPVPASRTRLLALPGGLGAESPQRQDPQEKPADKPAPAAPRPSPSPAPGAPKPTRPIPTPGEVFPRRKPTPPPANPQQLAAG